VDVCLKAVPWAAVFLVFLILVVWWRLREVITRYRSIRQELDVLCHRANTASGARKAALDIVVERCSQVYHDPFPKAGSILGLGGFVSEVARCYHPEAERPELAVRCGRVLWAARRMSERTGMLLNSPGFGRLYDLRLRRIRLFYSWFQKIHNSVVARSIIRWNSAPAWMLRSRLIVFPDPFSWLAFLSHRLVVMSLLRCIITDLYLTVGMLAVECYDDQEPEAEEEDVAAKLSGFSWFQRNEEEFPDPRIRDIRRSLPGATDSFNLAQWGLRWNRAIERAALVFASDQFPSARNPLEEASFGAVVERFGSWLLELSRLERKSVLRAVLGLRLETVLGLRDFARGDAAAMVGRTFRSFKNIYSGIRTPVRAARWVARGSAGKVAFEAGLNFAGKIFASYCFRYGFDLACRELDIIYRKSRSGRRDYKHGKKERYGSTELST
jgi:hypothetical protein